MWWGVDGGGGGSGSKHWVMVGGGVGSRGVGRVGAGTEIEASADGEGELRGAEVQGGLRPGGKVHAENPLPSP